MIKWGQINISAGNLLLHNTSAGVLEIVVIEGRKRTPILRWNLNREGSDIAFCGALPFTVNDHERLWRLMRVGQKLCDAFIAEEMPET